MSLLLTLLFWLAIFLIIIIAISGFIVWGLFFGREDDGYFYDDH